MMGSDGAICTCLSRQMNVRHDVQNRRDSCSRYQNTRPHDDGGKECR